jgi:hypothetical protein
LSEKDAQKELDEQIIRAVETAKPENVQQLIDRVKALSSKPRQEVLERILQLQQKGRIHLEQPQTLTPEKLTNYLRSNQAHWYWTTTALIATTVAVVFTVPEDAYPLVYLRYTLGIIFILWLPGYTFTKALFPQKLQAKTLPRSPDTSEKNLDPIEQIALSIGMSIALVPIVGLLLNYTPWGIRLTPIVLSLLALTMIFATAGIVREHETRTKSIRTG